MDAFMESCGHETFSLDEIHILGITSMFVASKFWDVSAVSLNTMYAKVGHFKFEKAEILASERELLLVLGFKLPFATAVDKLRGLVSEQRALSGQTPSERELQVAEYLIHAHYHCRRSTEYPADKLAADALFSARAAMV